MGKKAGKVESNSSTQHYMDVSKAILLIAAGGLAQTVGETLALGITGTFPPWGAVLVFSSSLLGITLMCIALWRVDRQQLLSPLQRRPRIQQGTSPGKIAPFIKGGLLTLLFIAALWTLASGSALLIQHPLDPAIYDSDAAAFVHYQDEDVLRGINPYTDLTGFWQAVQQFPDAGATPLQRGQFAQQTLSPDGQTIAHLLSAYARAPSQAGPEFDPASLHSYPAGAFLLAVPFIWAGFPSTQPLYILCLLLLFCLLAYWTPAALRWQTLLLLISLSIAITLTLRSSFEVVCILCVVSAWHWQAKHPWISAILLGVGCAVKQLTWLFVPFYLIWVARREGWRRAAQRGAICLLAFLIINAPFLFASPTAWASSMLLPISEPAFPGGIGLITLAQGRLLPLFPAWVYSALEVTAYLGLLGWYSAQQFGRRANNRSSFSTGAWALLLAPLPLLLSSRSLISYTMFLPVLALAAVLELSRRSPETPTGKRLLSVALPEATMKNTGLPGSISNNLNTAQPDIQKPLSEGA